MSEGLILYINSNSLYKLQIYKFQYFMQILYGHQNSNGANNRNRNREITAQLSTTATT